MASISDLKAQIAELQRQVAKKQNDEKKEVIKEIVQKMADYGITIDELSRKASVAKAGSVKAKAVAKYRIDDVEWSGFGRKPQRIKEFIGGGGRLEDIEIK